MKEKRQKTLTNSCCEVEPRGIPKEIEKKANGITEMVFVLDASGSMEGLEKDTIGGFNSMIAKQKKLDGKAFVTTVLFSFTARTLHDRLSLEKIEPLTEKDYEVGGGTALYDAVGSTIKHIKNIHKYIRKEDLPSHTIFVITTDGYENASREFSRDKVKQMIENAKQNMGWEFVFLGANIDAVETAEEIGISADRAVNYDVEHSTDKMYQCLGSMIDEVRITGGIPIKWAKDIDTKDK